MKLHRLSPPRGARKKVKKIGRGTGSGHGKTATKGHKGQRARSGGKTQRGFEGGQMPLARRLPKRGFDNPFRVEYEVVNIADLARFSAGTSVTPETLAEARLTRRTGMPVKILGTGELSVALTVTAHRFSKTAAAKIKAAGGTVKETNSAESDLV